MDRCKVDMRLITFLFILPAFLWLACSPEDKNVYLFSDVEPSASGVDFINQLAYTEQINPYTYKSFYNGGGVGLGDFDNDGFLDIFFTGNRVSNRLYRNLGNMQFEDVTEQAGLSTTNVWSTGVSVVDIDGDGWLDIYVCKSGPPEGNERNNALYINNGDMTFTESAADFGLDNKGLSVHAAFFDYDRDGDLDCYLLNNSIRSVGGYDLREGERNIPDSLGGNKLLRNDNGQYVDVSAEAGIYRSQIGFGLGVTVSDINRDNWPDLYISNDFFERDYLYINNKKGGFDEVLVSNLSELSMGSMGADMADINNDGYTELFVTEMLPERHDRLMSKTVFESWDKYQVAVKQGYHHQFSRNVLQLNNQNGSYSEISRIAGVEATDWSWGALIFDMNNDGWKDIFVANGIYKDLLDQDYINFMANPTEVRKMIQSGGDAISKLVDMIPSEAVPNYFFSNNKDLTFTKQTASWYDARPTFSNGSAYGDLDNDGDLDLVLNNLNEPAQVLRNNTTALQSASAFLNITLVGTGGNSMAIGTRVSIRHAGAVYFQELSPMRGFQSSVDYRLHFGLDTLSSVDEIEVIWPDGRVTTLTQVATNQFLTIDRNKVTVQEGEAQKTSKETLFTEVEGLIDFTHQENDYVDFDRERLLYRMNSNEGPCLCKADINGDGLEDIYIGGAKDQAGAVFIQQKQGFQLVQRFEGQSVSEDQACAFFDANGDGRPDLYVGSGGSEFNDVATALIDRLYFNDGNSRFIKSDQVLPTGKFSNTSTVVPWDFDDDGDLDLFVGSRMIPGRYGLPATSYLLINDGSGVFTEVAEDMAKPLEALGMVTDAGLADMNGDGQDELVLVGEWMPVKVLTWQSSLLVDISLELGLAHTNGWYSALHIAELNGDGRPDLLLGNAGLNTRLKASKSEPLSLFINDFDRNGTLDQVMAQYYDGQLFPLPQLKELGMQIPLIKKEYLRFSNYREVTMSELFEPAIFENAMKLEIHQLNTALFLSNTAGTWDEKALPIQAQFTPVFAIATVDVNADGHLDLLLGGNMYKMKPELGINDASFGMLFTGNGQGDFEYVNYTESGIFCKGEVREILEVQSGDDGYIIFARNNQSPYTVKLK